MAEIRLRDVSPELRRKVEFIKKEFKEVQASTAIEKLIQNFPIYSFTLNNYQKEILNCIRSSPTM
jgi:hypothetical protein